MLDDFRDKVAVVTGAASGIGAALCAGFAAEGMRVVAADIDGDGAQATADAIDGDAIGVAVDVSDADDMARFADTAFDAWGEVHLLCNNAGVFQGGLSWERSARDWEWVLGVNVFGITHAIRSFVPRMIDQDTDGHIVNTSSVAAFVAGPASGPYVVSKCAAFSLTECLALDLAMVKAKIGASVLTPGGFDTGIAHTARVRPERFGTDDTEDGKFVVDGLAAMTSQGQQPATIVQPVLDGIRNDTFVIPTTSSYATQIQNRYDALLDRRIPGPTVVD